MIRPQQRFVCFGGVGGVGYGGVVYVWLLVGVVGGEGDVVRGMPVFGRDSNCEREFQQLVHYRNDVSAGGYSEGAILGDISEICEMGEGRYRWTEIFLEVYYYEGGDEGCCHG